MKEKIKKDLAEILSNKNNICNRSSYLEKIETLINDHTKANWEATAQYHNSKFYLKSFPLLKGKVQTPLSQLIRLSGGYVVEVKEDTFVWNDCEYKNANEVIECIWKKEN